MAQLGFKNIIEVLRVLPEEQMEMVQRLHEIIYESIPDIREVYSSGIPYYKKHKGICYILPSAFPWGNTFDDSVEFGFQYGCLLADEMQYLERGNRKQVFTKKFNSIEEINTDEEILKSYLIEANEVDEIEYRNKKKRVKSN